MDQLWISYGTRPQDSSQNRTRKELSMKKTHKRLNAKRKNRETKIKSDNCDFRVSKRDKMRVCLKCGKQFSSKGPHNRICVKCDLVNLRTGTTTYSLWLRLAEVTEF